MYQYKDLGPIIGQIMLFFKFMSLTTGDQTMIQSVK